VAGSDCTSRPQLTKRVGDRIRSGSLRFSVATFGNAWTDERGVRHYTEVTRLRHTARRASRPSNQTFEERLIGKQSDPADTYTTVYLDAESVGPPVADGPGGCERLASSVASAGPVRAVAGQQMQDFTQGMTQPFKPASG